jgi:hypothetical protein
MQKVQFHQFVNCLHPVACTSDRRTPAEWMQKVQFHRFLNRLQPVVCTSEREG